MTIDYEKIAELRRNKNYMEAQNLLIDHQRKLNEGRSKTKRKLRNEYEKKDKMYITQLKRNTALTLLRKSNIKINEVRDSSSESPDHIAKKKEICQQLLSEKKQFVTEAIFEKGNASERKSLPK